MYNIDELKRILLQSNWDKIKEAISKSDVNEFDKFGNNILHFYIKERDNIKVDYKKIIDLLISNGLNIEGKRYNKYIYGTVLQLALIRKQKDIFDYLLELGAEVDATNSYGSSTLLIAVMNYYNGDGYYIEKLIQKGADIYKSNHNGISPISLAYSFDNNDAKKIFSDH